jgi:hypothetical protein
MVQAAPIPTCCEWRGKGFQWVDAAARVAPQQERRREEKVKKAAFSREGELRWRRGIGLPRIFTVECRGRIKRLREWRGAWKATAAWGFGYRQRLRWFGEGCVVTAAEKLPARMASPLAGACGWRLYPILVGLPCKALALPRHSFFCLSAGEIAVNLPHRIISCCRPSRTCK